ncbi:MAG: LamG-like jellyroll fold domain-containing protein [Candidatus Paceibacterota bacterium]|jgi:prepilin-type N-terminal cleavage/methylation domain-containing protein
MQKAFTLIELLVVIAIVGILAGMVVVNMSGATESAKIAKSKAFSGSIRSSLLMDRISEWRLDEGSGTSTADSLGSNNGILVNGPVWKSGGDCVSEGCLQLDGTNDYIDYGSFQDVGNTFTFSIWFKTIASQTYGMLISEDGNTNGNVQMRISGKKIQFRQYNGPVLLETAEDYNDGKWHFVVGSSDDKVLRLYVDGALKKTGTTTMDFSWNGNLRAGVYSYSSGYYFNGSLDEASVYSKALSISYIRKTYLAGLDSMLAKGLIAIQEYNEKINGI